MACNKYILVAVLLAAAAYLMHDALYSAPPTRPSSLDAEGLVQLEYPTPSQEAPAARHAPPKPPDPPPLHEEPFTFPTLPQAPSPPAPVRHWQHKPQLKIESNTPSRGTAHLTTVCPEGTIPESSPSLRMPAYYSSNMVLQRAMPYCIAGSVAAQNTCVRLVRTGAGHSRVHLVALSSPRSARAGTRSRWRICLPKEYDTGPFRFVITAGPDTLEFDNVVYGDVWVCAGLSRMHRPLHRNAAAPPPRHAARHPGLLRVLRLGGDARGPPTVSPIDGQPVGGRPSWVAVANASSKHVSSLCYFFGSGLFEQLQDRPESHKLVVPVGLVQASSPELRSCPCPAREPGLCFATSAPVPLPLLLHCPCCSSRTRLSPAVVLFCWTARSDRPDTGGCRPTIVG